MSAPTATTAHARTPRKRKRGISPWVPNQHGAWAMLISPAVLGVAAALHAFSLIDEPPWRAFLTVVAIVVAWFFGYFAFFAFGLVAKARTPKRKKQYLPPVVVYGSVSVVAMAVALIAHPQLIWWAVFFGPLVAVAVWETLKSRPRSMVSGVSTTVASALLVPVLSMAGHATDLGGVPTGAWASAAFLALYFSGTIPLVKTMIREKGNKPFYYGSVAYHVVALVAVAVLVLVFFPGWLSAILMVATMVIALWRAWWMPHSAQGGRKWTAKAVGMAEIPVLLIACVAVLAAIF